MLFQKALNKISPKKLFLIDSLGALVSALLLGLVLARFEAIFGMPQRILYFLSFIAVIFFIYSFLCFIVIRKNPRPYIKIIAIANQLYVGLTLGLLVYLYQKITVLGFIYFVLELSLVVILVIIELKVASTSNEESTKVI